MEYDEEYFEIAWEIMQELVSLSIASSRIKKIIVKQKNSTWTACYPPISIWIQAEKGSLKTTMFNQIAERTGHPSYKKITASALAGSIRRESGSSIMSPAWVCRNSVMLLDEFNLTGKDAADLKQALLDITEFGLFKRAMAVMAKKIEPVIEDDLYYKVYDGTIEFKTRCAVIFATMIEHDVDPFQDALMSRCIPIKYKIDTVDRIFDGGARFEIKQYEARDEVTIGLEDWVIIYQYVKERIRFEISTSIRIAGILAKVYAVKGYHDYYMYQVIIMLKNNEGALDIGYVKKIREEQEV